MKTNPVKEPVMGGVAACMIVDRLQTKLPPAGITPPTRPQPVAGVIEVLAEPSAGKRWNETFPAESVARPAPKTVGSPDVLAIAIPVLNVPAGGEAAPLAVANGMNMVVWPVTAPEKLITVTGP